MNNNANNVKGQIAIKSNPGQQKPSILDKNKLKLILGNLRNDNSNQNKNNFRPRYLNTIESEGNLQS